MELRTLLAGNPRRSGTLYLAIGIVSLAKAIALRNDETRFKRELLDAGLFIGVGVLLRQYGTYRDRKRQEFEEQLPEWLTARGSDEGGIRSKAKRHLGTEPEPQPSLSDRAMSVVPGR